MLPKADSHRAVQRNDEKRSSSAWLMVEGKDLKLVRSRAGNEDSQVDISVERVLANGFHQGLH
jgi:hypothetical protein